MFFVIQVAQFQSGSNVNKQRRLPWLFSFHQLLIKLLGFVFCTVLRGFTSNERCPTYLECSYCLEDGEQIEGSSTCGYSITELYSDHVFLWYDRLYSKHIMKGVKTRLRKGEDIPNVSFEFYVVTYDDDNGERTKHEGLIKECGVHPVYASEQHMELAPESKMKSKWGLDEHGSFKGQVYSRKRKNKGPLTTSGAGESIKEAELASTRAAKVSRSE